MAAAPHGASIFAALEQQLALTLVAERAPVDMLCVDHADRVPTED